MVRPIAIGLAGTAKNTGKTTATQAIIAVAQARGIRLGLTSIGYDGETWDNVTRLPKPRITVPPGTMIATAEACLRAGTAHYEMVERTASHTPLGQVMLVRTSDAGRIVLAGPHTGAELVPVLAMLAREGSEVILVDGAINRIMPMAATNGIILSTGAAHSQDIGQLAQEAGAIARIFALPRYASDLPDTTSMALLAAGEVRETMAVGSILTAASGQVLANHMLAEAAIDTILIPGQASLGALHELLAKLGERVEGLTLVLSDPIKLLLAGEARETLDTLATINERGGHVAVMRQVALLAITVNPFYPRWRYERDEYEPAYVDAEGLRLAVQTSVDVPVVDVLSQGAEVLMNAIGEHMRARVGAE